MVRVAGEIAILTGAIHLDIMYRIFCSQKRKASVKPDAFLFRLVLFSKLDIF